MILVTGASGNVGGELVRLLQRRGQPVRALIHGSRPSWLRDTTVVDGDLNQPATLAPSLRDVRSVFLLPGYRDMPGLLAALRDAGVDRVVQLSGGSAGSGDMGNAISAYMIRSERAVFESRLPWTVLRPAALMSNALRWVHKLAAGNILRLPFATVRTATIDPAEVAAVAAEALMSEGHDGQIYYPTGPESLTPADQVEILAAVLGRDLGFEAQPDDEARAEMLATTPVEYVDAFFDSHVTGTLDESEVSLDGAGRHRPSRTQLRAVGYRPSRRVPVTASPSDDDNVLRGCTPTVRPIGQHTNHAGSVERVEVDQALLSVLTTEHFTLQGARSSTISESSARAALYVGAVSSGLVALGFVGSDPSRRDVFRVFAGVVLPSLYVMGVFTFARLVASWLEDLLCGRAINRIRHVYLAIAGVNRRFLLLGGRDDPAGVLANMGITRPSRWQLLYTLATMILMLNAVIGGCAVAFFTALTAAPAGVAIGAGVAAAAVSVWLHLRYLTGAHRRAANEREIVCPTTPPAVEHDRESSHE